MRSSLETLLFLQSQALKQKINKTTKDYTVKGQKRDLTPLPTLQSNWTPHQRRAKREKNNKKIF